jgi:hypothetical protein
LQTKTQNQTKNTIHFWIEKIMFRSRTWGVVVVSSGHHFHSINKCQKNKTTTIASLLSSSWWWQMESSYSSTTTITQPPLLCLQQRPTIRTFHRGNSNSRDTDDTDPSASVSSSSSSDDEEEEDDEDDNDDMNNKNRRLWGDGIDRGRPLRNDWGNKNTLNTNLQNNNKRKPNIVGGWKAAEVDLLKSSGALWAAQQEVARDIVLHNTLKTTKQKEDEPDPPTNIQIPKLYVYNLHRDMDSHYFREMFERKARIPVVMAEVNYHPGGASQCSGIVEFQSIADTELAVQRLFGKVHMNRKVYMREYLNHHPNRQQQPSTSSIQTNTNTSRSRNQQQPPGYWVRVENLHPDTHWKLLKDIMTHRVGGNVLLVQIGENPHTGETFGRVKYETQTDAEKAIQTYQEASPPLEIQGKRIHISPETHPHVPIVRTKQQYQQRSTSSSFGTTGALGGGGGGGGGGGRGIRRNKRADWSNW